MKRLALITFALLAGCSVPPAEPTYSLVAVTSDGEAYVLDYGLTLDDCRRSTLDVAEGVTLCEREA